MGAHGTSGPGGSPNLHQDWSVPVSSVLVSPTTADVGSSPLGATMSVAGPGVAVGSLGSGDGAGVSAAAEAVVALLGWLSPAKPWGSSLEPTASSTAGAVTAGASSVKAAAGAVGRGGAPPASAVGAWSGADPGLPASAEVVAGSDAPGSSAEPTASSTA